MVGVIAFSLMCVSPCISACAYPGPFSSQLSALFALEDIAGHRMQLEALKQEECTILQGLDFFKIEWTPSKTIQMLEKVLHINMFRFLHTQRYLQKGAEGIVFVRNWLNVCVLYKHVFRFLG